MNIKLFFQAIVKFILGVLIVFLLLFIPAGDLNFINGWLFIGILFIPMFIAGIILMFVNPELLKRRLNAKEKESTQKGVIIFSGLMFLIGFIIAGLNYRFNWIIMPNIVIIISSGIFMIAYIFYAEVLRENTYLSRTIKVEKDQKVIDKGMYKVVRHPMYMVTVVLFLMIPLILNSIISLAIFLIYPFILVKRIKNEEEVLKKELNGYEDYMKKVKYRLIPYIW